MAHWLLSCEAQTGSGPRKMQVYLGWTSTGKLDFILLAGISPAVIESYMYTCNIYAWLSFDGDLT